MTTLHDPDHAIAEIVAHLATLLPAHGQMLGTAESCTGGLIAAACTDVAGSSAWFERGYVTYSNAAKQADLGVAPALLDKHGAVSEPVVAAMTRGVLAASVADWAIAVSGVAGPGGSSKDKPVGTVYIGWRRRAGESDVVRYQFNGQIDGQIDGNADAPAVDARSAIRRASVLAALLGLRERVDAL